MRSAYAIRPAIKADLGHLVALREDAERWLRSEGIRQWTSDYADYARSALQRAITDAAAWVVVDAEERVVATASLSTTADPDFWGWLGADEQRDALYVGKMIVGLRVRGVGLGDAILNWASTRALDEGRHWLRLDVRRDNTALQGYYLDRGFTHVRVWHEPSRRTESGWLAQRPAGLVLPAPAVLTGHPGKISTAPIGAVSAKTTGRNRRYA